MPKCYYAHPMSIYDTAQEKRDIDLLQYLGFEVVNPNRAQYTGYDMDDFCNLARTCDVVAFRALPDGSITSGVAEEIKAHWAVFELPSAISRRSLTITETLEALHESGQR